MAEDPKTAPAKPADKKDEIDYAAGEFSTFALEEAEDKKYMRWALGFAAVFHLILLAATFPELRSEPIQKDKKKKLLNDLLNVLPQ